MSASGNIYDLGYRGYDGPRLGRGAVVVGFLRGTLASAYGIGRGGRAKIWPFLFAGLAVLPAIFAVGITAIARQSGAGEILENASPIRHDSYQGLTSVLIMFFCAAQAPELFGKDQRYGVLPLYFSRVLTRNDYALARTGGVWVAVLLVGLVPHLVLTLGSTLAAADPVTGLIDELPAIPRYLASVLLATGLLALVGAVVSAWVPRRAYATATIIAIFIIPPIIVAILAELAAGDAAYLLVFASVGDVLDGLNAAIFGTIADSQAVQAANHPGWSYVVATIGAIVVLGALVLRRYQTVSE